MLPSREAPLKKIAFVHVPKTAGQSLAVRLGSGFPRDTVDILGRDLVFPNDLPLLQELLTTKSLIARHLYGPLLRDVTDVDLMTAIREPVSHMASYYLHIRRSPGHRLYRAATVLPTEHFFHTFADLLVNFQARYLIGAFGDPAQCKAIDWSRPRTWSEPLMCALDRFRWVLVTESLDEFIWLWQCETRIHLPYSSANANVAVRDNCYAEVLALAQRYSQRSFADLVLWQSARRRFADYRKQILRILSPPAAMENDSRSFWDGHNGIWLLSGWYPSQLTDTIGRHWWAGPDSRSEVSFVRQKASRFLHFEVGVLCGVSHDDLWVVTADLQDKLPLIVQKRGDKLHYWVDVSSQPECSSFYICVPEVLAPVIVDPESDETRRMSFAATKWSLVTDAAEGPPEA